MVENIALRCQRNQSCQPSGDKRQFGTEDPGAMQVHNSHIAAQGFFFRPE
jgi:hypothetical protein